MRAFLSRVPQPDWVPALAAVHEHQADARTGTQVYKLPSDRLYASYFGGDEALGLKPDEEARSYW